MEVPMWDSPLGRILCVSESDSHDTSATPLILPSVFRSSFSILTCTPDICDVLKNMLRTVRTSPTLCRTIMIGPLCDLAWLDHYASTSGALGGGAVGSTIDKGGAVGVWRFRWEQR